MMEARTGFELGAIESLQPNTLYRVETTQGGFLMIGGIWYDSAVFHALHFTAADINACRAWLRENGLECLGVVGWQSADSAARIGLIDFHKGEWHAAIVANPNRPATAPSM